MASWLDDVQRDPRTLGAFRRRIEALLTDPAVARRIARRLEARDPTTQAAPTTDRLSADALHCASGLSGSIFGRCNCPGTCCLMMTEPRGAVPKIAALPMLSVVPGLTRH